MDAIGVDAQHIPYKGAEALNDLIASRIDFMFATIPSVIAQIKGGKLRAIAVSSPKPWRPHRCRKRVSGFLGWLLVWHARAQRYTSSDYR